MLQIPVAKVAVLAATFAFDRPYTYKIPQPLAATLRPAAASWCRFRAGTVPARVWCLRWARRRRPEVQVHHAQLDPEPSSRRN